MRFFAPVLLSATLLLGACDFGGPSVAVVDVNKILTTSPHAKQAQMESDKAQAIYQNNLNAIEKKLAAYKDKKQAEGYLIEAARQLQAQLNTSRAAVSQSMGVTLKKVLDAKTGEYDIIVAKGNLLANKDALDITAAVQGEYDKAEVTWPNLPQKVDDPQLPADNKGDKPAAEKDKKENTPAPAAAAPAKDKK